MAALAGRHFCNFVELLWSNAMVSFLIVSSEGENHFVLGRSWGMTAGLFPAAAMTTRSSVGGVLPAFVPGG
jgi:hypothetical protein